MVSLSCVELQRNHLLWFRFRFWFRRAMWKEHSPKRFQLVFCSYHISSCRIMLTYLFHCSILFWLLVACSKKFTERGVLPKLKTCNPVLWISLRFLFRLYKNIETLVSFPTNLPGWFIYFNAGKEPITSCGLPDIPLPFQGTPELQSSTVVCLTFDGETFSTNHLFP
jgi:hypothetical protein